MSMENARKFYEKVSTDKALQQKIGELAKEKPQKMGEIILKIAKENGFDFTEQEMKTCIAEKVKIVKPNLVLNDDELESVAGGKGGDPRPFSIGILLPC